MNSEDEARVAYRLFLGREPRPQEIIARQQNPTSMRELMDRLLASKEFEQRGIQFRPYIKDAQSVCGYSFDFLVADPVADAWYGGWTGETEAPEVRWCLDRIREGMTALDCGAHHGFFSIPYALAVGRRGRVVAWEAWPNAADVAVWNLALNGCDNAQVRAVALGEGSSAALFYVDEGTVYSGAGAASETASLPTVRLDDDLPTDRPIDFIKIDVEGAELEVLRGARHVLSHRPIINLEIHNFLFTDRRNALQEIEEILKPFDYYYWVQKVEDSGEVCALGKGVDLRELASWENPHLFCEPK